jgi:hypothetical protein
LRVRFDGRSLKSVGAARYEAARTLIANHKAVLADMLGDHPPPSQPTLTRVPAAVGAYAEQALRELCRHLLVGSGTAACRGWPSEALSEMHPVSARPSNPQPTSVSQYHPHRVLSARTARAPNHHHQPSR